MKNNLLQFILAIIALCMAAAMEELLPKISGLGLPLLLAVAAYNAVKRPVAIAVVIAVAAGAMEDAISMLPFMSSVSFFLLLALVGMWKKMPRLLLPVAFFGYQIWLMVWYGGWAECFGARLLLAMPLGLLAGWLVCPLLTRVERSAAIDEQG